MFGAWLRLQRSVRLGGFKCTSFAPSSDLPPNSGCTLPTSNWTNSTSWHGAISGLNPLAGGLEATIELDGVVPNITRGKTSVTLTLNFNVGIEGNANAHGHDGGRGWTSVYNDSDTVAVVCDDHLSCTSPLLFNMDEVRSFTLWLWLSWLRFVSAGL